ncbi:hypothetical protein CCACVL1_00775, partial [Corchorus capsularis]
RPVFFKTGTYGWIASMNKVYRRCGTKSYRFYQLRKRVNGMSALGRVG